MEPKMSYDCQMLALVLTLCALVACARADCDACVAGRCHSRRPIVSGFTVTDQLAIDRTNNVLYLQFNNYINTAIFLDDRQSRLVNMMRTRGMTVDQETGDLYMGTKEVDDTYYIYKLVDNRTQVVNMGDHGIKPELIFYINSSLFFIDKKTKSVDFYDMSSKKSYYKSYMSDYLLSDFVIGEGLKIFFVSNDTVYVYYNKIPLDQPPKVLLRNNHVLSVDKYDAVYLGDASGKVIYKRDNTTEILEAYASYTSGAIEDFVFDRDNRVVFRDAEGVAQWVPTAVHRRCVIEREIFVIPQVDNN